MKERVRFIGYDTRHGGKLACYREDPKGGFVVSSATLTSEACEHCGGQGWYTLPNKHTGAAEQIQCERCHKPTSEPAGCKEFEFWQDVCDALGKDPESVTADLLTDEIAEMRARLDALSEPVDAGRQPAQHELKCWPEFYSAIESGEKNFEIRRADRNYQVGDILTLREWNQRTEAYTGRECQRRVTYILEKGRFGLLHDFLCMGVQPLTAESANQIINQQKAEIERLADRCTEYEREWGRAEGRCVDVEEKLDVMNSAYSVELARVEKAESDLASARSDAMREAAKICRERARAQGCGECDWGTIPDALESVASAFESSSGKVL